MRITTLNLRGFFDWETRVDRIVGYLDATDPDLAVFQEVVYLPDLSPRIQPDLLNDLVKRPFPYRHASVTRLQSSPDGKPYREGLASGSRHPVVASEALVLRHEQADPHNRLAQLLDVDVDGSIWKLANVHLSIRDDYALHHLEEVLGILDSRGEKRIIGGDFNINHLERHRSLWKEGYVLTSELEQYVSYGKSGQANDYFLVPKEYAVTDITLSDDGLSDHRALTIDVKPVG
ncbi:endonuclease/exonuclease/phosphatase family protein [Naasia lichenicola]|uniref:Endonuclease/exonuclease/phosphatase domain-containing protein n=1 Tax=Naasia lichenicola TaxID=2565933 RepID=A0A4S4FEV7_9MICO|nr:endonuclease/exonuclease/phosphatase family protein [Naasia lichenicola]THG28709.1 hypothetical protein E6C64_18180 [Naasia lichenicola]